MAEDAIASDPELQFHAMQAKLDEMRKQRAVNTSIAKMSRKSKKKSAKGTDEEKFYEKEGDDSDTDEVKKRSTQRLIESEGFDEKNHQHKEELKEIATSDEHKQV